MRVIASIRRDEPGQSCEGRRALLLVRTMLLAVAASTAAHRLLLPDGDGRRGFVLASHIQAAPAERIERRIEGRTIAAQKRKQFGRGRFGAEALCRRCRQLVFKTFEDIEADR